MLFSCNLFQARLTGKKIRPASALFSVEVQSRCSTTISPTEI